VYESVRPVIYRGSEIMYICSLLLQKLRVDFARKFIPANYLKLSLAYKTTNNKNNNDDDDDNSMNSSSSNIYE